MKKRLLIFIKYLNITNSLFEKKVNLSNGFVSNIGSSVRNKSILKISEIYPEFNINWWKTGEGNMLKNGSKKLFFEEFEKPHLDNTFGLSYHDLVRILDLNAQYLNDQKELRNQLTKCQLQLSESQNQISALLEILKK